MADIDGKHLKGLKFKTSKRERGEKGERDKHVIVERPLKPAEVLGFSETETHVHIVAADGQKHAVAK